VNWIREIQRGKTQNASSVKAMASEDSSDLDQYRARIAPGANWKHVVAWVGDLPPLPHAAQQAISMLDDSNMTVEKLSGVLGQDTALAARVLRIANSSMYACRREITTINHAIMIIGFRELKGVVLTAALRQLSKNTTFAEQINWQNSTCTAIAATIISRHLKKTFYQEAFLIGLLHDLGKLVLIARMHKEYDQVIAKAAQGHFFVDVEMEILGYSHALIGALVAKKWNFSPDTCQVILRHHDTIARPLETEIDNKVAVVQAANLFSHFLGYGHPSGYPDISNELLESCSLLDIDLATAKLLLQSTKDTYEEQNSAFS